MFDADRERVRLARGPVVRRVTGASDIYHINEWIDDLRTAVALLTRVPMPHPDGAVPLHLTRAQRVFPLVGAAIGAAVALAYAVLLWLGLPPLAAAALALGASAALTGALHEDGLGDVADGFGGGRDREAKLAIMRDSRLGTYGMLALIIAFAAKLAALQALTAGAAATALIAAHALGRAAIPVIATALPPARSDGLGKGAGCPDTGDVVVAVVIAVVIALVCLPFGRALAAVVLAAIGATAVAVLAQRQIGGITGDVFGAAEQVIEIAVLLLVARAM